MPNFKMFIPDGNYTFYPDNASYDVMSFNHEVGRVFFISKDARMRNLKE